MRPEKRRKSKQALFSRENSLADVELKSPLIWIKNYKAGWDSACGRRVGRTKTP